MNVSFFVTFFVSYFLFLLGVYSILTTKGNVLRIFIAIEIVLLAINLNLFLGSLIWNNIVGLVFVLYILAVAAAEVSLGLALIVILHDIKSSLNIQNLQKLKG